MDVPSALLVCMLLLATCSVWTGDGRSFQVSIDDQQLMDEAVGVSGAGGKLPGMCWGCKWALNKVKKVIGPNATAEAISSKLLRVCDGIGLIKSKCYKFVKNHLSVLVEELSTTDDVRTICVNTGACSPKELTELFLSSGEDPQVVINVNARMKN